jgi:hypothetical protein
MEKQNKSPSTRSPRTPNVMIIGERYVIMKFSLSLFDDEKMKNRCFRRLRDSSLSLSLSQCKNHTTPIFHSFVGKTAIFQRAVDPHWKFTLEMNATIAISKPVVKRTSKGPLKLWDCGGQERFKNITLAYVFCLR